MGYWCVSVSCGQSEFYENKSKSFSAAKTFTDEKNEFKYGNKIIFTSLNYFSSCFHGLICECAIVSFVHLLLCCWYKAPPNCGRLVCEQLSRRWMWQWWKGQVVFSEGGKGHSGTCDFFCTKLWRSCDWTDWCYCLLWRVFISFWNYFWKNVIGGSCLCVIWTVY